MTRLQRLFSFSLILAILAGCSYRNEKQDPNGPTARNASGLISFQAVRDQVFAPNCISCHGSSGGVNLETYASVIRDIQRIQDAALTKRRMPPNGVLRQESLDLLSAWINAGAPEFAQASPAPTPSPTAPPNNEPLKPTFDSIKTHIFEKRCFSCHTAGGPAASVPLDTEKDLLESPRELVIPGDSSESGLFIAVTRQDAKRMPPPSSGASALSSDEIIAIKEWIDVGTGPGGGGGSGPVPGTQLSYAYVRERVFAPKCISCHGNSGNVNLESYGEVKKHLSAIAQAAIVTDLMPKNGSLSRNQRDILSTWLLAGAPETPGAVPTPLPNPSPAPSPNPSPSTPPAPGPSPAPLPLPTASSTPPVGDPLQPTFASIKHHIFEPRCIVCHTSGGPASGVPMQTLKDLLNSPRDLVLPGDPEESGLVIAVTRTDAKRMPPPSTGKPPLSDSEIAVIKQWITNNAPEGI